ncbi:hypothetical protein FIBSPDRAFT_248881 [Athelia psychrophila]|uniref:Uncharacterized protein n=1 Tax=Athelia psychrophila TaxID=1759441 RepID=A0A165XYK4_9AGAM|nr:hypothetical protein FIBSPDRAFT_248881 [Fibularhizoctonia sp. CBS 109695]
MRAAQPLSHDPTGWPYFTELSDVGPLGCGICAPLSCSAHAVSHPRHIISPSSVLSLLTAPNHRMCSLDRPPEAPPSNHPKNRGFEAAGLEFL